MNINPIYADRVAAAQSIECLTIRVAEQPGTAAQLARSEFAAHGLRGWMLRLFRRCSKIR